MTNNTITANNGRMANTTNSKKTLNTDGTINILMTADRSYPFSGLSSFGLVLPLRTELIDFKTRRVAAFRKNLVELAELELKHAKVSSW